MGFASNGRFILNDDLEPVPEGDLMTWSRWMEEHGDKRRVALSDVGGTQVSAVFLGLDYSYVDGASMPMLYETMVFGGDGAEHTVRSPSREAALAAHAEIVRKLKAKEPLS